jgi:hypothetical protein
VIENHGAATFVTSSGNDNAAGSGYRVDPIPCRGTAGIRRQLDPDLEASEGPIIKAEERPHEPAPALRHFSRALP